MANRNFHKDSASLERGVVTLYAPVSIGASGASTLDKVLGVASVDRDSAGTYDVVLQDNYMGLLHVNFILIGADQDATFQLVSENVAAGTFQFTTKDAGTVADLASGSKLLLEIVLKNTSVEY